MKQKRLQAICEFLDVTDSFIDIGCDHAYVSIYMAKCGCSKILATDIHQKALDVAIKNIKKNNLTTQISVRLSDGLKEVDTTGYDTLVISGMGASTIMHILSFGDKLKNIKKIILQSNNDLLILRTFMNKIGYELSEEKIVNDFNHYYVVMKWVEGKKKLSNNEKLLGLFNYKNKDYYMHLLEKNISVYTKIPKEQIKKRKEIEKTMCLLKEYIKRAN